MASNSQPLSQDVASGLLVPIGDTRLFIVEHGQGYPLLVLHGGPGLDHTMFGDYLNRLTDQFRLILVDQRSQGRSDISPPQTWTLAQMARDVVDLASALGLKRYAVLGHSFGALVALQYAVDFPDQSSQTIVSSGFPSARFLVYVQESLETFEPVELREQVMSSWEREKTVQTQEEFANILHDQLPFHFADPLDPRIEEYERRSGGSVYSPQVIRYFARQDYGMIEVEDRLGGVSQPVLVLAGRHDRTCSVEAAGVIAGGIPQAELVIFEQSGHMTFVEENEYYLATVRKFLGSHIS
jgi:proline iminopeptidase